MQRQHTFKNIITASHIHGNNIVHSTELWLLLIPQNVKGHGFDTIPSFNGCWDDLIHWKLKSKLTSIAQFQQVGVQNTLHIVGVIYRYTISIIYIR